MEVRGRRCRESSPERAKVCVKPRVQVVKPTFRRVQVVYYLSRNGRLEHPHFMEVTHLAHQHLRLKDVMDRLTVLRGKGMPSLYSWSCKRSYKNGYVWNDLTENDIIYPSEGAEYVLKGSEILEESTEKLQQLQISSNRQVVPDPTFYKERGPLAPKRHPDPYEDEDNNDREEEEEYEEKTSYTSSRGVSTDETELHESTQKNNPTTELTPENSSPPSTTSSTVSDKANENNNTSSKRFEDGEPVLTESILSRNSVFLQLIACGGGSVSFKGKNAAAVVKPKPVSTAVVKSGSSLHKEVLCKTAAAAKVAVEVEDDEMIMSCMSENPRFGNLQAEEKEYFSGSIVESRTEKRVEVEPRLKKSSSYNEERSCKGEMGEAVEEELKREKAAKVKCIPRRKSSPKQTLK